VEAFVEHEDDNTIGLANLAQKFSWLNPLWLNDSLYLPSPSQHDHVGKVVGSSDQGKVTRRGVSHVVASLMPVICLSKPLRTKTACSSSSSSDNSQRLSAGSSSSSGRRAGPKGSSCGCKIGAAGGVSMLHTMKWSGCSGVDEDEKRPSSESCRVPRAAGNVTAGSDIRSMGTDEGRSCGALGGLAVLLGMLDFPPANGDPSITDAPNICADDGSGSTITDGFDESPSVEG